jgi:ribonuclease Z
VESFGYRIVERDRPGRLKVEQLAEMGIPPGPLYGKIKKEKEVRLDDGRIIRSADFVGERIPGRIIAILGDTRAVDSAVELARNADVLVHEATYAHELHERAVKYKHSTALEAAQLANKAGVRTLIMTHFSSRYKGEGIRQLLDEARSIHPDTYAAEDFWTYRVHEKTDRLNRNV